MKVFLKKYRKFFLHLLAFLTMQVGITMFFDVNKDYIKEINFVGISFDEINISILIIVSAIITLLIFKFYNSKRVFEVTNNTYGDYPIFIWRTIRYLFSYKKLSLKYIPIHLQLNLINLGFFEFEEYYDSVAEDDSVNVDVKLPKKITGESIAFLIEDSYKIDINQLPKTINRDNIIVFTRLNMSDNRRLYTRKMIQAVDESILNLPNSVKVIELFMNTNPLTTLKLAKNCFFSGGRRRFKLRIYQYQIGVKWVGPKLEI